MEKKSRKSIIIGITSLFLVMLLLVGLTYAYYRTRIIGNDSTDPSISVVSKKLEVKYTDGNSTVNMQGLIEPGFEYTKTFTVENTGDDTVGYVLYLEDVVNEYTRTEDWTYEITCSPNCNGTDGYVEYPTLSEKLLDNEIASKTTQTYNVTIKYADSEDDQSDDMGATIEGKFNIYSPEYVVDIEGEVAGASEGDYVQINSVKKISKIVNGKYRLPAVEVGSHTLRVMSKTGTEKGKTTLTINKGTQGINGTTITMDDKSETVTLNITSIASNLGIEIKKISEKLYNWNNAPAGTLLYAIKNDNTITYPVTDLGNVENNAVFSYAEDDYGTSYYYRGAVENNFVNFSGMCWRIVRVDGNGNIKLALADGEHECNESGYSLTNDTSGLVGEEAYYLEYYGPTSSEFLGIWANGGQYYAFIDDPFSEPIEASFDKHIQDEFADNLAEIEWCEDYSIVKLEPTPEGEVENDEYYGYTERESSPTFKCDMTGLNNSKARTFTSKYGGLTADEFLYSGNNYLFNNVKGTHYLLTPYYLNGNADVYHQTYIYKYSNKVGVSDMCADTSVECSGGEKMQYRPVIALKSSSTIKAALDTTANGAHGTYTNPYEIN